MEHVMSLDEQKKLARKHIELSWNKGHLALSERLHSKDFLYKSSFVGSQLNSAGFSQMVRDIRTAVPDLQVVIEEFISEGDKVVTWSTMIGTIETPAFGYPASDNILSISAMAFWTISFSGEIQEICTMFDMESFRAQQGLAIQPFEAKSQP
jgi:steroid delta-isomerase-like uncharacterized protein